MNSIMCILPLIIALTYFNPTTNGENVPDPSCPVYTQNDTAKILPDKSDCTKFFICDAGRIKRPFECPCGLLFNSTLRVCDWPDNVNCTQPPRSCIVTVTTSTTDKPQTTVASIVLPVAEIVEEIPNPQQEVIEEIPPQ